MANRIRSPDARGRNGVKGGNEDLRYLSPGAFTILSPEENGVPPDPPRAPAPYRLAPKVKRNRNQAFAIIAEPVTSRPTSRSPSPSGRVSPFRGRGFNPKGSRFDVPPDIITGPPPEDIRTSPLIFGEKVTHPQKFRRKAGTGLHSKSMTNIAKTPASPSRYGAYSKGQRLSPITGSSPDSRKSSTSKIPRSRSQPPSRRTSPATSGAASRTASRTASRSSSPQKPVSSTTSPSKKYDNIQAKVNSFNKTSVKDTTRISEESEGSTSATSPEKMSSGRAGQQNRLKNVRSKVALYSQFQRGGARGFSNIAKQNLDRANAAAAKAAAAQAAAAASSSSTSSTTTTKPELTGSDSKTNIKQGKKSKKKTIRLADLLPDANAVVSSTTSTVTKPLKLEFEKVDSTSSQTEAEEAEKEKVKEPELTLTSVSSAINRMNDTILDSKTVMGAVATTTPAVEEKKEEDKKSRGSAASTTSRLTTAKEETRSFFSTKVKGLAMFLGTGARKSAGSRLTSASSIRSLVRGASAKRKSSGSSSKMSLSGLFKIGQEDEKSITGSTDTGGLPTISQEDEKQPDAVSDTQSHASPLPTIHDDNESKLSVETKKSGMSLWRSSAKAQKSKPPSPTLSHAPSIISITSRLRNSPLLKEMEKNVNNNEPDSGKQSVANSGKQRMTDSGKQQVPDSAKHSEVGSGKGNTAPSKHVSPEHSVGLGMNTVQHSARSKLDLRTEVAEDVQPLRITVQERPMDGEVQSGNVRLPVSATNGVSSGPGLPPSQPENEQAQQEDKKPNICSRMATSCRSKMSRKRKHEGDEEAKGEDGKSSRFNCCSKKNVEDGTNIDEASDKSGCFNCRKQKQDQDDGANDEGRSGCFSCGKKKKTESAERINADGKSKKGGCFGCCRRNKGDVEDRITVNVEEVDAEKKGCFDRIKCCRTNKVADKDKGRWCSKSKKKESWADRKESMLGPPKPKRTCKNFFKKICCCCCQCCKKEEDVEDPLSRRISTLSKNKSLTPMSMPLEDMRPKLDLSLVEHTSHMKGAIPVLPVSLAWFCCIFNIFLPGTGTIFSGMFCLCIGKARFSQRDGAKQRIGAFIIDLIIGCGQAFTVLFCLVGWGWSIWWGVIMIKVAKRQRKLKLIEEAEKAEEARQNQPSLLNHRGRDLERGLRGS